MPKVDERVGVRKRQRFEDPGLDHAEHHRGPGDADGERHQGDRGQPRGATQRARGVPDVVGEVLEGGQALLLAIPLLERLDAAKGQQRRTASGVGRQAPAYVVVGVELEVAFDLVGHLALAPTGSEHSRHAIHPR